MSENVKRNLTIELIAKSLGSQFVNNNKLMFYEKTPGFFIPISVEKKCCKILEEEEAMKIIKNTAIASRERFQENFKKLDMLDLTFANAKTCFQTLKIDEKMHFQKEIKIFAFKSEDCLTFNRIPFDRLDAVAPTPEWDTFLTNYSNTNALKMWIGSLFFPNSDRAQYLWLYGKGGNGKSTLAKIISKILGNFVRYEQVPAKEDKYWTYGLIGKRLIVIDDCNNYGFVKTGVFKQATGSGAIRVEQKFGNPRDTEIDCKFLFTSNEKPLVSKDLADQRRIILSCALNKVPFTYDAQFLSKLGKELPEFISNCCLLYEQHCADGRPIPSDTAEALELAENFDEEIQAWIEANFEYDSHSYVEVSKFREALSKTRLSDRRVYSFLEDQNIARKDKWLNGKTTKIIPGLKQKIFHFNSSK